MTILEKIKFEEDWLSEVSLTKENVKIALEGIRATVREQQTCEDCISKEEALKHSHIEYDDDGEGHRVVYVEDIEELPYVTPQPKVGKWIKTYEPNDAEPFILWECSECQNTERGQRSKYCPNCGSYNGGERNV